MVQPCRIHVFQTHACSILDVTIMSEGEDTESVEKYQDQFEWLKDSKFLHDLENDSIDSEIIEEELSALQEEEEPISPRRKLVKLLQSNPVQILLCVIVLLDAGIVIAQILLDLHSVRNKLHRRENDISRLLVYIKDTSDLYGYEGEDIDNILQILEQNRKYENLTQSNKSSMKEERTSYSDNVNSLLTNNTHKPTHHSRTDKQSGIERLRSLVNRGRKRDTDTRHRRASHRTSGVRLKTRSVQSVKHPCVAGVNSSSENCDNSKHIAHLESEEHDTLHEAAHGLHFASVSLLGFLVLQDLVKIIAMGSEFFKHKIEIFDAVIITSSFVFDIVFLEGVTGGEGEKAAAVLVVLLLWRLARVADGIMITVKQRQEFRIKLQKRARRKADRRIDNMEEERHTRIRQISALKELCSKAGVKHEEIEACAPTRQRRTSTTLSALTSVARLSLSMTMSMSSGLFSLCDDDADKHDDSTQKHTLRYQRRNSDVGTVRNRQDYETFPFLLNKEEKATLKDKKEKQERSSPTNEVSVRTESPVNSSGIQIVIDEGSDEHEPSVSRLAEESHQVDSERSTFLRANNGSVNRRRSSSNSEVYLLSEMK